MTSSNKPLKGLEILKDPRLNKSTAFTEAERDEFGLRGLLPSAVSTQEMQVSRVLTNLRRKTYDIERYVSLLALQGRNERLFYRLLIDHIDELLSIVYTPTVGQACSEFSQIFRHPRGLFISIKDRGRVREILDHWPEKDIKVIVVTDGERILGLGDLGVNGMGIPIGKLALYTTCAGIPPHQCLPVILDVGTNNKTLIDNPLYLGLRQSRVSDDTYFELVDEFVQATQDAFPETLIQFEDFVTLNAYQLLNTYRQKVLCFNDDIQGTAAVTLAGVIASCRVTGIELSELRIMFLGAGAAATGIADLIKLAMCEAGLSESDALQRLWFVDQTGLVVKSRNDLAAHKLPYAHDAKNASFIEAINTVKPHVLIGATGAPASFTEEVVRLMADINQRPVIFALSNPTTKAECTAEEAYQWSDGRAVFASGSPFDAVIYNEKEYRPGQSNNVYVFPGIGLGSIACQARFISDEMFLVAARTLANITNSKNLEMGTLFPPLAEIRNISLSIAVAVAELAIQQNLVQKECPADLEGMIRNMMYDPTY